MNRYRQAVFIVAAVDVALRGCRCKQKLEQRKKYFRRESLLEQSMLEQSLLEQSLLEQSLLEQSLLEQKSAMCKCR
jgi:hypothetical protein